MVNHPQGLIEQEKSFPETNQNIRFHYNNRIVITVIKMSLQILILIPENHRELHWKISQTYHLMLITVLLIHLNFLNIQLNFNQTTNREKRIITVRQILTYLRRLILSQKKKINIRSTKKKSSRRSLNTLRVMRDHKTMIKAKHYNSANKLRKSLKSHFKIHSYFYRKKK